MFRLIGKNLHCVPRNGAHDSSCGAKVSWNSVWTSKESRGLRLRKLADWNKVFGLKLIWLLFTKGGSLWISWVQQKLICGRLFWDFDNSSSCSWIWKRLLKLRSFAPSYLSALVGSRPSILFWHDDWTSLGPLIDLTGSNGPRVTGIQRLATLSQAVHNDNWILPRGRHPIVVLLRALLPYHPPVLTFLPDRYLWKPPSSDSNPDIFSSSSTWYSLQPTLLTFSWFRSVWFAQHILKNAFLFWIMMRERLPSRDHLLRWRIQLPSICLLYN